MITLVTVTSQGQISIPAKIRRMLGFEQGKALLRVINGKIELEPERNITDLRGVLKKYGRINRGKTIDSIVAKEERATSEAILNRFKKKKDK